MPHFWKSHVTAPKGKHTRFLADQRAAKAQFTSHIHKEIRMVVEEQWRSQNAEKVTHRLLNQTMILSNCIPFQNENFSYRKEFALRGSEFFPLKAVP